MHITPFVGFYQEMSSVSKSISVTYPCFIFEKQQKKSVNIRFVCLASLKYFSGGEPLHIVFCKYDFCFVMFLNAICWFTGYWLLINYTAFRIIFFRNAIYFRIFLFSF